MISAVLIVVAYLLGSIPFGLILTKVCGLGDIRQVGSGNIGATNVLRTGNKKIAAFTLLLDMLKGYAAVSIALYFIPLALNPEGESVPDQVIYAIALVALLGHVYPIWLKGKGGKGVATYFGTLLAISPFAFFITLSNWLGVFYTKRISSFSALMAALFVPLWLYVFTDLSGMIYGFLAGGLLAYTHRANIERLMNGTEPRFDGRSQTEKDAQP